MSKITVKAKINGGVHPKYGRIVKGQEYTIEEADFGDQLFERAGAPNKTKPKKRRK